MAKIERTKGQKMIYEKATQKTKKSLKILMWVIRTCKTKRNRQYNDETEKRQTMMDKTLYRKLKMEQHQLY
jgi:hypothetical protein